MPRNPEQSRIPLRYAIPGILAFTGVIDAKMTDGFVRESATQFLLDAAGNKAPSINTSLAANEHAPVVVEVVASNEISSRMINDLAPYEPIDPDWAYNQMEAKDTYSQTFGEQISIEDAMRYFYIAGFRGDDLKRITAISRRESRGFPGAIGDWNFKNSGSISVGMTQIRCITEGEELPCVGPRDWRTNLDPMQSAINSYALYKQSIDYFGYGKGSMGYDGRFQPWKWWQEHIEKYGPDPAENEHLPQVEGVYGSMQAYYGDLSV
jgi:hypothetical protein